MAPRFATVPAKVISARRGLDLRADSYVFSPERESDELLTAWLEANPGFMHRSTPAMKDLRAKIVAKLEAALAAANESGHAS